MEKMMLKCWWVVTWTGLKWKHKKTVDTTLYQRFLNDILNQRVTT